MLDNLIEGDIRPNKVQRKKRNAIRISQWKWKNNIIPYVIEAKGFCKCLKELFVLQFMIKDCFVTELDLITEFDLLTKLDVACQQRMLTSSVTCSWPN